jgi:hypothetical protein
MREIAPEGRQARQLIPVLIGLSAIGLVLFVFSLYAHAPARVLGPAAILSAMGCFGVIFIWLWLRNSRVLITGDGRIGERDLLGRTKLWQTAEIGRMLDVTLVYSKQSAPQRLLYVLSYQGRTLARLGVLQWGVDAIGEFVRSTGKELEIRDQPVSARAFRQEFPGAVSWSSAHPNLIGAGIAVCAICVPIAIVVVWVSTVH